MKHKFLISTLLVATFGAYAQKQASPPATAEGSVDGVNIKIEYHQPSAKGRKIMGGLVPYGEVWRTGANETTTIEFSGPVKIEGKEVAKGKYGLYTLPGENEWSLIINTDIKWGAFDYKQSADLIRVQSKPTKTDAFVETFNIAIVKKQIVLKWENTQVAFNVSK